MLSQLTELSHFQTLTLKMRTNQFETQTYVDFTNTNFWFRVVLQLHNWKYVTNLFAQYSIMNNWNLNNANKGSKEGEI